MSTQILLSVAFLLLFTPSCKKDENKDKGEWCIPKDEVKDGGPGKDGIPALANPEFISASSASYLSDNDLVLGYGNGTEARAYPHSILDWHEIINDDANGQSFAVIYCPLTGTGVAWNRVVNGSNTTFGVSGLLYNSNIIPYDRSTGSNWSQVLLKSVNGSLINTKPSGYPLVETTWKTWKQMFPSTKVVSANTGHNRNYGTYPYGDYKTNNSKYLFPVKSPDARLPAKERVLGVLVSGGSKVYRLETFADTISVIQDAAGGANLVVAGSKSKNFIVAYNRVLPNGPTLDFQPVQDSLPMIMRDNEGTRWDVFGRGVSGPRAGQKLENVTQFVGYWFAFGAFYPGIAIY